MFNKVQADCSFDQAVTHLRHGDFSALEPLFEETGSPGACRIIEWFNAGLFNHEPEALAEALSCACFLGRTNVVEFLLSQDVELTAGNATGMNGFHWAADRGQLETVKLLIKHHAPLEIENMYGGTVLGGTVWSAIKKLREDHLAIIEALLDAGARIDKAGYPTGHESVDEVIRRHGADPNLGLLSD